MEDIQDDNYRKQDNGPPYLVTPPGQPTHLGNAINSPVSRVRPSGLWTDQVQSVPVSPVDGQHAFMTSPVSYADPTQQPAAGPGQSHAKNPPPQWPHIPQHLFTEPYIAPTHSPSQQTHIWQTPQFEHPYEGAPPKESLTTDSLLAPPALPTRPTSAPPSQIEEGHMASPYDETGYSPQAPAYGASPYQDDQRSHGLARFVGNMLPVRLGRSGYSTITSTAKLPFYLSPWGDNNPMVLPNLRKRDVALAGVSHLAFGALSPSALSVVGSSIKHATTFLTEQAIHEGIHKISSNRGHRVRRQAGVVSWDLRIKHKLIGEEAQIVLMNEQPATHPRDCARGWLCPYLYASGRTPQLPRSKDFSIAQFMGPGLAADVDLAPTFLYSLSEAAAPISAFCPWQSLHPTFPRFRRLAIFLLGISPYRKSWSQSRIPSEARISFHLFTHVPAIVLPVKENCPLVAWSPWTLEQMTLGQPCLPSQHSDNNAWRKSKKIDMDLAYGEAPHLESLMGRMYDSSVHLHELLGFANAVVDRELLPPELTDRWRGDLAMALEELVNAAVRTAGLLGNELGGVCDMERTGVAMVRY